MFRAIPVFQGVPGCSGVPVFRGVPGCSGVPVFRCSGVPVFRGVPGCSGVPGFSTCRFVWQGITGVLPIAQLLPCFNMSNLIIFLAFIYWQGHRNSVKPITAGP